MNSEFSPDLGEVLASIRAAEVIALHMPFLGKTLLVDTRYDAIDGPMVRLAPVAQSIEDRFRTLKRMRPRFSRPESIAVISWTRTIRSLESTGLWDSIVVRCSTSEHGDKYEECRDVFIQMLELEREERANAVIGSGYKTLWQADRR